MTERLAAFCDPTMAINAVVGDVRRANPEPPVLLFAVNDPAFFLSHRVPIAIAARDAGYDVHVAAMPGPAAEGIAHLGFAFHPMPLNRSGVNPAAEMRTIATFARLFRHVRPDVVHLVTIKPMLYGGIAARLTGVKAVVSAVSGLGYLYVRQGAAARLTRGVVQRLYRMAMGHRNQHVIVQNGSDAEAVRRLGRLDVDQITLIPGSGVRLADYPVVAERAGRPVVTMAARLLADKGVHEFIAAARVLHGRGVDAEFRLVGNLDPGNRSSLTMGELDAVRAEGIVSIVGHRRDIAQVFAESSIIVLPSYREGLPKVLIEAAACGRPVVTTDVPGCRDAIVDGETGVLVPARNVSALAHAIGDLLADHARRQRLGQAGRRLAEERFAIEDVVRAHLDIYERLLADQVVG